MPSKITILRDATTTPLPQEDEKILEFVEFKRIVLSGQFLKLLFRHKEAQLLTYNINFFSKPFNTVLLLRLISQQSCSLRDEHGNYKSVDLGFLLHLLRNAIVDFLNQKTVLQSIQTELSELANQPNLSDQKSLNLSLPPVYLRTDLSFALRSGGSVGHIAGVLNNLSCFVGSPIFLSTTKIPTVSSDLEQHLIVPEGKYWDCPEIPSFNINQVALNPINAIIGDRPLSFVYQRYCLNNILGVKLSRQHQIPFVLEYNGSEIWVSRHWGTPLKYEALSQQIELLNLNAADVIVVVSRPLQDELVAQGIAAEKILVNPNGVEPDRYSPDVDGSEIRHLYGLQHKTVIGFIGTFGKWHGAEVLAEAFGLLLQEFPELKDAVRLLMIGDGVTMPQVRQTLSKYDVSHACILTGLVAQAEGPKYLAACDILASPHVPNPDGTPFFGSPTKLFEYMAMGKGIVASNLEQIGEVLHHDQTAWLVEPGNATSLMRGLQVLIEDEAKRMRLGQAARQDVVKNYSWKEHTRKIIEKLKERCSTGS
uniref:Glycosyl transferase group 1 n=1 Tax=Cyanothece sp. (strain PCC 7425 / ATCC 29141) TaxID=395961 RepID=B8HUJ3_CYAP4